jgi:hypothetical protein
LEEHQERLQKVVKAYYVVENQFLVPGLVFVHIQTISCEVTTFWLKSWIKKHLVSEHCLTVLVCSTQPRGIFCDWPVSPFQSRVGLSIDKGCFIIS